MKISRKLSAEIAILSGVFGFFVGGLIGFKREIVEMLLLATITGGAIFTAVLMILLTYVAEKPENENKDTAVRKNKKIHARKGGKLDLTVNNSEDFEDIFNLGKK